MKTVGLTVLGIVVAAALLVGLWFGYWALAGQAQSNRYNVNTHSQQYQAGLVAAERDRIAGYDLATDTGQKTQIKITFCQVYTDLDPAPEDLALAYTRICN